VYWLYDQVLQEQSDREPLFSEQSALNWIRALSSEVTREHGETAAGQFLACRRAVRSRPRIKENPLALATIFEPLVGAIVNVLSLQDIVLSAKPWQRPPAIVAWYYAIYGAVRAMFAAIGRRVGEQHAAANKAFAADLRCRLPHPFNMLARHRANEEYEVILPTHPDTERFDISSSFPPRGDEARGMLLEYLSGTARWYLDRTKQEIRSSHGISSFRTKSARELRDKRVKKEIAFMHCAYRFRTKANYRDAIYLTYGTRQLHASQFFEADLASVGQFAVLAALAVCEFYLSRELVERFLADLSVNLRGIKNLAAPPFWTDILSSRTA
jgi:hypothetical protein